MSLDGRHDYVIGKLVEGFPDLEEVLAKQAMKKAEMCDKVDAFFTADGPKVLLFVFQGKTIVQEDGTKVIDSKAGRQLALASPADVKVADQCIYFVRTAKKDVTVGSVETDIVSGAVSSNALETFQVMVSDMYVPFLGQNGNWALKAEDQNKEWKDEFVGNATKFGSALSESVTSLQKGIELSKPDAKYVDSMELKNSSFNKAASDEEMAAYFEGIMESWCTDVEAILTEDSKGRVESEDAGINDELDYWRTRMARFNSITEQLKTKECKLVLGVANASRSKALRGDVGKKGWKQLDMEITDAANIAKDNVKYLTMLDKSLEPLYQGTVQATIDALPALLNNFKLMHTIARYYNSAERMTPLFQKVTNQMIGCCKRQLQAAGPLWEQDNQSLLKNLDLSLRLNQQYQEQYKLTRDRLAQQGKKGFDFPEQKMFGKFDLFSKRVQKLKNTFTTIHQFMSLSQHTHIDGLQDMIKSFFEVLEVLKEKEKKSYDLLDYRNNTFDRDLLEFEVTIHELEETLQKFIKHSFESITSTDHALNLLKQFQAILQRDSLKADLDDKYMVIFQNYGLDLETVQKIYEKHCKSPPLQRNAPPVAGNILWARQLLRRIEEPMRKFSSNESIMNTKESRRIINTYNKVASALIMFETLWHQAWIKCIDNAKAGLHATLIVKHQGELHDSGSSKLLVNFDPEILQLIKETKFLQRMEQRRLQEHNSTAVPNSDGEKPELVRMEIPEAARMVLLQEDKFKSYFNQLTFALQEYERVTSQIRNEPKALLQPFRDELDAKIRPGMFILTWTSMNIDGYLHRVHAGIAKLELLVRKCNDLIDNRLESNLREVRKTVFVDLPSDQSFTFESFVNTQTKNIRREAQVLAIKNMEVQRGVEDLIDLCATAPRENMDVVLSDAAINDFRTYYSRMMYKAVLTATQNSFGLLKKRLGSRSSGGFLFVERPFFDVDVELSVPNISMNPSLADIQLSVNATAKNILKASKELNMWGRPDSEGKTYFDALSKDMNIVKSVLLLTGSIEGLKNQVYEYITIFSKYDHLWKDVDIAAVYNEFQKTNPTIEEYEAKLREYMAIEHEIGQISPVHNIGSLSLETQPLKYSLKNEASTWKSQYAKTLHLTAKQRMDSLLQYMTETSNEMNRQITDLEDVRAVMNLLGEVRDKEAEIDSLMSPIEEGYGLLTRYEVRVPKEELDQVSELRYVWKKLKKTASDVSENLSRKQAIYKRTLVKDVKTFVFDVYQFRADWEQNGPMVPNIKAMDAVERLRRFKQDYATFERKWKMYSSGEELFGLPVTPYPELEKTEKEISLLDRLYSLYVDVIETMKQYEVTLWEDVVINIESWTSTVTAFQAQSRKLPKVLKEWEAFSVCKKTIDDFLNLLPLLTALSSNSMRPRHWGQLMQITGRTLQLSGAEGAAADGSATGGMRLRDLLDCDLLAYAEDIEELASGANKEEQIEKKLNQIAGDWTDLVFTFAEYKARGFMLLKAAETAELIEKLDDSQMQLGSMATNRYSAAFREEISGGNGWIAKLSTVSEVIESWSIVQNMWMYMEAVFSGGDIAKQLPQEKKRFDGIDKNYTKLVQTAFDVKNVVQTCFGQEIFKTMLPHLTEQLELCQKSLTDYLDKKRGEFPRFFFVSDPVLLEILSQGSDPQAIQNHFQSGLFDSCSACTFDKADKNKILELHSAQGEILRLSDPFTVSGNIEEWLQGLVTAMQKAIHRECRDAYKDALEPTFEAESYLKARIAQVGLLGIQFLWTFDVQSALDNKKTDKTIMAKTNKKVLALLDSLKEFTTKDLSKNLRKNVETVITVHVHQRDVADKLTKNKSIKDSSDFEWMSQARFYYPKEKDTVIISVADVDFEYSYEYLGVKERLVITPLTDKCYLTLSQALGMFLGGAPAGPAGTGKTETTKDMGNTLGKFVVVFNCSDQMDYKGMGKIYRGLAQSGLWGCFDEFNRINLDVLSVCAQQVFCVLQAIRERKQNFVFTDGSNVSLDARVGFFITMNPGYAGRQELPENLKSLFRGVMMMVPNRQIIMSVKLSACGYKEDGPLGKKFFVLYGLCEQQLSKQRHYDFGLRNILSVLRTMGSSKRANPEMSEEILVMRTLRDMNMSKFVAEDVPLFLSLIGDLFPGLSAEKARFPDIESACLRLIDERGLQAYSDPSNKKEQLGWFGKVIQLYETYQVRHGIMLVGPTGGGKSTVMDILCSALSEVFNKHVMWRMNPKSITDKQMFGKMDAATGDWTDGIFAALWRRAAKNKGANTWIVLDGPVDAIWIENLNTVLDDNKVLTLANGDRIGMTESMKAMFEPENLNNASPATVSRAGIIYVSDTELGFMPLVHSWLADRKLNLKRGAEVDILTPLLEKYLEKTLNFIYRSCSQVMANQKVCLIRTFLVLLESLLKQAVAENETYSETHIERIVLHVLCWSAGALIKEDDRLALDAELRKMTNELPDVSAGESLFEYYVTGESAQWTHWQERTKAWNYPVENPKPKFASLVIPTLDSTRYQGLIELVMGMNDRVLLVGGPGTTKTSNIMQYFASLDSEKFGTKCVTFSSLTTPNIFQAGIEASVEKRQGKIFGPPGGKSMCMFIDDISMPTINDWGDQVTNELTRQVFEQGGFYSFEKPGDMKFVIDMFFFGAMNIPGGGKNDIPSRLKRQFCVFNQPLPSVKAITNIFGKLVAGRFAVEAGFQPEVTESCEKMVGATIGLWNKTMAKMLPTPAKFHYLFNMRDLSRVFQGVLLAERDRMFENADSGPLTYILRLWKSECDRVFSDKFVSEEDKSWFESELKSVVKQTWGDEISKSTADPMFLVDFLRPPVIDPETDEVVDANPKNYEAVESLDWIREVCYEKQKSFNETSKALKLDLVLFDDALKHLIRISRMMGMSGGSALLVGVGGSGKQSLTRLAASMAGAFAFQCRITKQYNVASLLEDLKNLYKIAGIKGQPVAFIFTDAEIKEESFLEYINQLLMTGEIAGLFPKDELDIIVNDIRPVAKKENPTLTDTYENLYGYFLERVRENLHTILCFSPVGPKFARRSQQFPGLINGCTIDWFMPWPLEALVAVSTRFIGDFKMDTPDANKKNVQLHMGFVHNKVTEATKEYFDKFRRFVYVTPKSYLSFIQGYKDLYTKKYNEVRLLADKINNGLTKLYQAGEDVAKMKIDLAAQNVELEKSQKASAILIKEITAATAVAETEKVKVNVIKTRCQSQADEIGEQKKAAEEDLALAQPAMDAAEAALNSISPKDIQAIKALGSPPALIQTIMDAVLVLRWQPLDCGLEKTPTTKVFYQEGKVGMEITPSFSYAKVLMNDMNFLNTLLNYPKDCITDEQVELLQPYLMMPNFNPEAAKKASAAAPGLCNWCKAMATYQKIAKVVGPKLAGLRAAEGQLKRAMKELQTAQDKMDEVQAGLDKMQADFEGAMAEKQRLEDSAVQTQKRMDAANQLIGALAGEKDRWENQSKEFEEQIQRLTGDCALGSSFISYCGPFNKEMRDKLTYSYFRNDIEERSIPLSEGISITSFLASDSDVGMWALEGLPSDDLSVQNGILVTNATRYPILVDPQGQGMSWITARETPNNLRVTSLADKFFRNILEDCLAYGKPMLIENILNELDPILDPVLEKQYVVKGKNKFINFPDKEVDVSDSFSLFATTRLPNPHYSPELSAKTTIIDFTVTMAGLEDQLLNKLIFMEKKELEDQRQALLSTVTACKKKIAQLEDDLLTKLSNSQGNLLDDTELIETLNVTKITAKEVSEKLAESSDMNASITATCENYRPVATRASIIYFLIAEFAPVDVMYQTSLRQFTELYEQSIANSEKANLPNKRIANIIDYLTYLVYSYVQRGLYTRHKLIFAIMMGLKIQLFSKQISFESFNCFLKAGAALDINSVRKKPDKATWLADNIWLNIMALSSLPAFSEIADSVVKNLELWRNWYDQEAPEVSRIPDGFEEKCSVYERMLLVRAFREDRALLAAQMYVQEVLGQRFVDVIPLSMQAVWEETKPNRPVIAILSKGSDPTKLIEELAKKKKIKVLGVSMGQGQERIARRLLQQATTEGAWLLLQNTHLGLAYLEEVEAFMVQQEKDETLQVHESFRCFITAESHPEFPIGLLQLSIKMTNEAPVGMRAGLTTSYTVITQDMLDTVQRFEWRQLLFVLCFLHSVVQERRKFGPIGWNVPYEFNASDLSACMQFLQNHIMEMESKKSNQPTWSTVRYMISNVQYGGRITDDYDVRLMDTYAERYFRQDVLEKNFELFPGPDLRKGQPTLYGESFKGYNVPDGLEITQFQQAIDQLPSTDVPEIFGLHMNADITFRTLQSRDGLQIIIDTQPKTGGGGGGLTREEIVDKIAEDLLKKLPADFKGEEVKDRLRKMGAINPLNIHLKQEIDRLQGVMKLTKWTLTNLRLAIAGTVALTEDLISALNALFDAVVPGAWLAKSWPSGTIGAWFTGLLNRYDQLFKWISSGRPKAFWMTGFFNAQGFLTAMKQEVCRKHSKDGWALDEVVLWSEITHPAKEIESLKEGPAEGVYIYGLYLDGAGWHNKENRLVDSEPKKMFYPCPILYATGQKGSAAKREDMQYSCPCYTQKARNMINFITAFDLRTEVPPEKWILRSVALLCTVD